MAKCVVHLKKIGGMGLGGVRNHMNRTGNSRTNPDIDKERSSDTTLRLQGQRVNNGLLCEWIRYNPALAGTTDSLSLLVSGGRIQPCACRDNSHHVLPVFVIRDTTLRLQGQLVKSFGD